MITHLRPADIRGIAQLATQATTGATRIAEGVHQSVWDTLGVSGGKSKGQTGGITGLVYSSVRGVIHLVGKGVDSALAILQPLFDKAGGTEAGSPRRETVLATLNGVIGDHLAATNNPLATTMTLRHRGEALNWQEPRPMSEATGKVLLMVHGLCMGDVQWQTQYQGQAIDHGATLASDLGYTPVYLRYNTGLHTSHNGRKLSQQLEQLITVWPTPLDQIDVVAHSMGGLLIRSAVHYAQQEGHSWPRLLKNIVFLGTPHHGAPLEQAGNWVDTILGSTRYTKPFAKLGHIRSAGITDLRYGSVLDTDWSDLDRFQREPDNRSVVPLPEGVACYTVAATTAAERGVLANRIIGDGLVPLQSALGHHDDPRRRLRFAASSQRIVYRTNHVELLSSPEVGRQMVRWLGRGSDREAELEAARRIE